MFSLTVFHICLVRLLFLPTCIGFVDILTVAQGLKTFCTCVSSISIGIMSMFFVVFAVHVAFLVTSLCAGVASVEAGIA